MSNQLAAGLSEGTRVASSDGRTGTVNGYDVGHVTNTEHANYGRKYIGVTWDPTESIPWGQRSRPFVDELTIIATTDCASHAIKDRRGERGIELGFIPVCGSGITYGAWSEGAGGFVYSGDCATDVANWAADELRQLAKEDDTDKFEILAVCRDHEDEPKDSCGECASEGCGAVDADDWDACGKCSDCTN